MSHPARPFVRLLLTIVHIAIVAFPHFSVRTNKQALWTNLLFGWSTVVSTCKGPFCEKQHSYPCAWGTYSPYHL